MKIQQKTSSIAVTVIFPIIWITEQETIHGWYPMSSLVLTIGAHNGFQTYKYNKGLYSSTNPVIDIWRNTYQRNPTMLYILKQH